MYGLIWRASIRFAWTRVCRLLLWMLFLAILYTCKARLDLFCAPWVAYKISMEYVTFGSPQITYGRLPEQRATYRP